MVCDVTPSLALGIQGNDETPVLTLATQERWLTNAVHLHELKEPQQLYNLV